MADFITAAEFEERFSNTPISKKNYEYQHTIIEYRLENTEEPYIIVPYANFHPKIQLELRAKGYTVCFVQVYEIGNNFPSNGWYIGPDKYRESVIHATTEISWQYWAKKIGLDEN